MTSGGSSGKPGRSKTLAQKVTEEKEGRAEAKAGPEDTPSTSLEELSEREPGHHPSEQAREEAEAAIRARSLEAIGAVLAGEALSGPEPDFEALAERLARLHEKKKEEGSRASLSSSEHFSSADSADADSPDAEERIAKTIERLHHLADRERVAYVRASRKGITRRDETKREATKKTG